MTQDIGDMALLSDSGSVSLYLWKVSTVSSDSGTSFKKGLGTLDARSTILAPYAFIIGIGTLDGT